MKKTLSSGVAAWALCVTAFLAMGMTMPNTFAPGTTISSAQVNQNFAAIKAAVDALEAKTSATTQGNILGYAQVSAAGVLGNFYLATGGTPVVTHPPGSGFYTISWPPENVGSGDTAAFVQVLSLSGVLRSATTQSGGAGAHVTVRIVDGAANPVDETFWILVIKDHNTP